MTHPKTQSLSTNFNIFVLKKVFFCLFNNVKSSKCKKLPPTSAFKTDLTESTNYRQVRREMGARETNKKQTNKNMEVKIQPEEKGKKMFVPL